MTSTERWRILEDAFEEAMALHPSGRDIVLNRVAQQDPQLRSELENLLAAAVDVNPHPLESAIRERLEQFAAAARPDLAGRRIGHYRITRLLGEGGMGVVYLAVRDDDQFEKTVAIKFLKPGLHAGSWLNRFRHERQILATLEHPNVARLLDAGTAQDGSPYIVMEAVDGQPITDYCRGQALPIPQRIRLFRDVCAAVQFAHQQLIVHRDLKPSNILVTAGGVPKLLDFGIAKLLDANAQSDRATTGLFLLTPDYASPEQLRGGAIGVGADVYALGAVLYELLSGSKPHALGTHSPEEVVRAICDTQPPLCSQAAPPELRGQLRGDLDNILAMALEKDPARRYGSVEQLSADLERYLERKPVLANKSTFAYRTGKFIRRNVMAVSAGVLLIVTLAGGIVASTMQARRADRRFHQVRELAKTLLFGVHDQLAQVAGTTKARETLVRTAQTYLDSLASEAAGDRDLLLELADSYEKLGDVESSIQTSNLGKTRSAIESFQKAVKLGEEVVARGSQDPKALRSLASKYYGLGYQEIQVGDRQAGLAHLAKFRGRNQEAIRLSRPESKDFYLQAAAFNIEGDALVDRGQIRKGIESFRKSLRVAEEWERTLPGSNGPAAGRIAKARIGDANRVLGNLDETLAQYRESAADRIREMEAHPEVNGLRRRVIVAYGSLANVLGDPDSPNLGNLREALAWADKAMVLAEALAKDPEDARAQADVAESHLLLARLMEASNPSEARIHARKAATVFRRLHERNAEKIYLTTGCAGATVRWASLRPQAEWRSAAGDIRSALDLLEMARKQDPGNTHVGQESVIARLRLGDVLLAGQDQDGARRECQQAIVMADDLYRRAPENLAILELACRSRESLARLGSHEEARSLRRQVILDWDRWLSSVGRPPYALERRRRAAALPIH
jgi:tetratricopeptide (TPR) repeat protein